MIFEIDTNKRKNVEYQDFIILNNFRQFLPET